MCTMTDEVQMNEGKEGGATLWSMDPNAGVELCVSNIIVTELRINCCLSSSLSLDIT